MTRRYGKFEVTAALIRDNPEGVVQIFADVLVTRAEHLYHKDTIEYIGMSKHFRELGTGEEAPEYMAECTHDDDGDITVRWVEQK